MLVRSSTSQETQTSPNGNVQLTFDLKEGVPYYSLTYKGQEVIKPSRLGLELVDDVSLTNNFTTGKVERSTFDETWTPVWGESSTIRNHYNEMAVTLTQQKTDPEVTEYGGNPRYMTLRFRVYNDGIGSVTNSQSNAILSISLLKTKLPSLP